MCRDFPVSTVFNGAVAHRSARLHCSRAPRTDQIRSDQNLLLVPPLVPLSPSHVFCRERDDLRRDDDEDDRRDGGANDREDYRDDRDEDPRGDDREYSRGDDQEYSRGREEDEEGRGRRDQDDERWE